MKKIYLQIFLLFLFGIPANAQVNDYFLNNPQWKTKTQVYSGSDCVGWVDTYNLNVGGDSIIGAFTYKKIFRQGIYSPVDVMCNAYAPTLYTNSNPSYYLRSAGQQMYIIEHGSATEQLLYDFDLNVGDTLPVSYTILPSNILTVTAIDSISTPFGFRKRFHLNGACTYLYEGIGTSAGIVEPSEEGFLSGTHDLLCFSLNDISYVPTTGGSCEMFLGIADHENKISSSVFPNPFSKSTTIQFDQALKNATITLYNATGTKIKTISFSGDKIEIERDRLIDGIYYYQVVAEDGRILNGKLAIVN